MKNTKPDDDILSSKVKQVHTNGNSAAYKAAGEDDQSPLYAVVTQGGAGAGQQQKQNNKKRHPAKSVREGTCRKYIRQFSLQGEDKD